MDTITSRDATLTRIARTETAITPLPGRDWHTYFAPGNAPTERVSLGVSVFEPGARPVGHVHDTQDETVYCLSGRGRLLSATGTAELEAGVVVHIPPGTFHATECDPPDEMELLCIFTPPVVPGSYEKGKRA
jgi:quercetin dioxygenase-like cupin family protein